MARILIIKLSALGDVIIASAAIQRLLQQHQNDQVELLTNPSFAYLFKNFQNLTTIPLVGRSRWQQLRFALILRQQGYQRIYDLQGNDRSRMLTWLINAKERIGLWPGRPYQIAPSIPRQQKTHPFQRINALLEAAGVQAADPQLVPICSDQERVKVRDWLQQHQLNPDQQKLVLIHAGCSERWPSKRWPEQFFGELAQLLSEQGLSIIWVGGPDEQALNDRLSTSVGINAGGEFTVTELVALAEQAAFAITNDSGPMHILASANIPVYSFFGPTGPQFSHAVGQAERVLSTNLDCSPCFQPQCPLPAEKHHRCMLELTPQKVLERLRSDGWC